MFVDIPLPVNYRVRTETAFMSQSHHIFGSIRSIRYFQADILYFHVSQGFHLYLIIDQAVETEFTGTLYFKITVFPGSYPVYRRIIPSGDPQGTGFQHFFAILRFYHEPHFSCQNRIIALIVQLVTLIITGRKGLRKTFFRQLHRSSQPGNRLFL